MHPQIDQSMINIGRDLINPTTILAIMIALLLSACSSVPSSVAERDIDRSPPSEDTSTPPSNRSTQPVRNQNIERAEYYERLSKAPQNKRQFGNKPNNDGADRNPQLTAALNAAEHYIHAKDFNRAEQILLPHLGTLLRQNMTQQQSDRAAIVMAYVAYSRKQYNQALEQLEKVLSYFDSEPINGSLQSARINQGIDSARQRYAQRYQFNGSQLPTTTQQIDALLLSSLCHQALGHYDIAISHLLRRESGLKGEARAETTRYTWQVIDQINVTQRLAIIETTNNVTVRNRLEQSLEGQIGEQISTPLQFSQWREQGEHLNQQVVSEQWNLDSAKRVAVLLPLNSRFNKASQALMDGIKYAHEQNKSAIAPQLSFYDIGDNPFHIAQHYSAAVNSGADFIIGPLGKEYANKLNNYLFNAQTEQPPTILLGGDTQLNGASHRFTLSPESNGERVARKAFQDGHLSVGLMFSGSRNNQRIADAFSRAWLDLGGKISKTVRYSPERFDHSAELKQLFGIYESEARRTKLANTIGYKPKFSAYKRPDIDFVFMIADNSVGRILRPQINFYGGVKMPVYSASSIFNGIQNNTENLDLEQTRFPVMPWVLRSANVAPYAGQLNQLYALGIDTYRLAGNYNRLKSNPNIAINGSTGQLSLNTNGIVSFQPVWANFIEGEAVAIDTLGINMNPLALPADQQKRFKSGQNSTSTEASYNDSNWDAGESSRKARP